MSISPVRRRTLVPVAVLLAVAPAFLLSQGTWTIRLRAMQNPLPAGACTAIELIVRDASGATPTRPGGLQITWQEFDFAIAAGAEGFAWRNGDPRSRFICATAPGVTATVTVSYPGAQVPAAQRVPGVRVSQTLQVASVAPPGARGAAPPGARPTGAKAAGGTDPAVAAAFGDGPIPIRQGDFSDILSILFGEHRFLDAAAIVLDSPLDVQERTPNGLRFSLQLPTRDGWQTAIALERAQRYKPTRSDLARAADPRAVYGVTIAHAQSGDTTTSTLRYFVPDRAPRSSDLRETWARLLLERVFDALIPPVHAQGADWAGSTANSVVKRVAEHGVKTWQQHRQDFTDYTGIPTKSGPRLKAILQANEGYDFATKFGVIGFETAGMLIGLDALRKCAENPTNLLTQREYAKNPGEKQKVLDAIDAASTEVVANGAVRVVNGLTGKAAGAISGAVETASGGAAIAIAEAFGQIEEFNDSALKEASQSAFDAANQAVVGCGTTPDPDPTMIPLEPMTVDITYRYSRLTSGCSQSGCGATQETREGTGKALINPLPGRPAMYYELRGEGSVKWTHDIYSTGATTPGKCGSFPWTARQNWRGVMTGRVEGTRVPGKTSTLKLTMSSHDLQMVTQELRTTNLDRDGKIECEPEVVSTNRSADGAAFSFQCDFPYVDLVSGGTFATYSNEKDRGYGTCVVTVARASGR